MTADLGALATGLRRDGATLEEAVIILSLVRELDEAVIDLAAWEHEARGPGGRWVRGNPDTTAHAALMSPAVAKPSAADVMEQHASKRQLAHAQLQTLAIAEEAGKKAAVHAIREAHKVHEEYVRKQETEEGRKALKKALAVIASLIAGAVLALVELKLGTPDPIAISTAIGPGLAESLFEWKNRL